MAVDMRADDRSGSPVIREKKLQAEGKWLRMQYQLMIALVIFATMAEAVMYFVLRELEIPMTSPGWYLLKYLAVPFGINVLLLLTAAMTIGSALPERRKIYIISTLLAVMAFAMYTVHAVFPALFSLFIIPMLLTVVYGDQRLTAYVALFCVGGKAISDLFLRWDPGRARVTESMDTIVDFGLSLVLLLLFYSICAFMILMEQEKREEAIRLEQDRKRYWEESMRDQLTRLWNREALRRMFQKMEKDQSGRRYFLAMMDLDDFKSLNDTYGHSQGDQYLQALGQVLLELSGEDAYPFRFGGDEFCMLFQGCGREQVERACREVQRCYGEVATLPGQPPESLSIGVAEYRRQEPAERLLDRADAVLYRAKQQKGSICFEED